MKTTKVFEDWKGMAPDNPRDKMTKQQVWLMRDLIPRVLGSSLEARNSWPYSTNGPLDGIVTAQQWVNTGGVQHYLAATDKTLYNLDSRNAPAIVGGSNAIVGALNPMAALFEFVCVPRVDQLPKFIQYKIPATTPPETVLTTHASTPKAKHAIPWNAYFVLANGLTNDVIGGASVPNNPHPSRLFWIGGGQDLGFVPAAGVTPAFDVEAWWDTSSDITALGKTRTALIAFHADFVERLRGGVPPGADRDDDLWMEPLVGLGGCTQPHSVCYWNDNILFCDGRGAYISDGTTIRDLTAQGGISRTWRRQQYTRNVRIAGGVYADFWVLSMMDRSDWSLVDCWVCDLYSRTWIPFSNVPVTSFVTATDMQERLYGGTPLGKVIEASKMWDDADPVTDLVDGNGVPVLPQLETAWYRFTENEAMKRIRNVFMSFDLTETAGHLKVYGSEKVQPDVGDWTLLRDMRMTDLQPPPAAHSYQRRRLPYGHESYGFCFRIETTGTIRSFKLYDMSVDGPGVREDSYAA